MLVSELQRINHSVDCLTLKSVIELQSPTLLLVHWIIVVSISSPNFDCLEQIDKATVSIKKLIEVPYLKEHFVSFIMTAGQVNSL